MKFKLSGSVIQRCFKDFIYLNDMRLHILTLLSSDAEKVIEFVREWRSKEEICKFFMDEFDISERLAEEYYLDIIEPLIKNGIIASDELSSASHFTPLSTQNNHEMTDEENDMLQYMLMNNIFWGVTLELTFSCNLRCPHCYISRQDRQEVSHLTAKAGGFQRRLVHGLNV